MLHNSTPHKAGYNERLLKGLQFFARPNLPHVATPSSQCMNCCASNTQAIFYPVRMSADFDVSILPSGLYDKFSYRSYGVCSHCGYYQDYLRFNLADLNSYLSILKSKDLSTSEEAFHTFPVPDTYVIDFNNYHFYQRIKRWHNYFSHSQPKVKRALFLRPFFGYSALFVREYFNSECFGLEVSSVAKQYINAKFPWFNFLSGNIHAAFLGEFLSNGPFDAIFSWHTLIHNIDIHQSLRQLKSLLAPGGFIVLSDELNSKPFNPFHMSFNPEGIFIDVLKQHFSRVDRISDCQPNPPPHITVCSLHGDAPDFIAYP